MVDQSGNPAGVCTPSISVVAPTYRRPDVLVGCVRALHGQTLAPLEVVVCYRDNDTATSTALASLSDEDRHFLREVVLGPEDNLRAALTKGIAATSGDLVALTDDDAEPPSNWLAQLVAAFDDESVAAVGGRDLMTHTREDRETTVGRVQWFGRLIGNHHAGFGVRREADFLKGVNCCFRGHLLRALGVDPELRGHGNVVHWELSLCLPLRKAGYRIAYDPSITLDHHVAPRQDGDPTGRGGFDPDAYRSSVHNETRALLDYLPPMRRLAFLGWSLLIGTGAAPGFLLIPLSASRSGGLREGVRRFVEQARGRWDGIRSIRRSPRRWLCGVGRTDSYEGTQP